MKNRWVLLALIVMSFNTLAWDKDNNPNWFDKDGTYRYNFYDLPVNGKLTLDKMPWANSFWPHVYGGIAFRWNKYYVTKPAFANLHYKVEENKKRISELKKAVFVDANLSSSQMQAAKQEITDLKNEIIALNSKKALEYKKYFFDLKRVTPKEALSMSQSELAKLAPTEKYDLLMNNDKMKLTNAVLGGTKPNDAYWEGICHGWSSAALEFYEPEPITVTNKNGLKIPFGSSDLKALLSYYHANQGLKAPGNQIGKKCAVEFPKESWFIENGVEYYKEVAYNKRSNRYEIEVKKVPENCIDTNPGAFHVVMANQLAVKNTGFLAEMVRDYEIWNQPVYEYETEIVKELNQLTQNRTEGTQKQVLVKTRLHYANDGGRIFWGADEPEDEYYAWWNATTGTSNYRSAYKDLEYVLDLDQYDNIIGGHWLSYDRPDFLWIKQEVGFKTNRGLMGYMQNLGQLVKSRY